MNYTLRKLQGLVTFLMIMAMTCSSIQAQELPNEVCCNEQVCCEEECAYADSCRATQWTAYIPIVALIGVAIWLSVCDRDHRDPNKNNSFYHGSTL